MTGPIVSPVGTVLPVKRSGDLRALHCEVLERLPKSKGGPYPGEQIATSGDSLIQDFSALLSFCLGAVVTPDQHLAQRLLLTHLPSLGMDALPKQYLGRVFDNVIRLENREIDEVQSFISLMLGASRKNFSGAMRAVQRYVTATHRLADDLELAYTLLVASIESLAQNFDDFVPTWEDYAQEKRIRFDNALHGASEDLAARVRGTVLQTEHVAAARRFREFVLGHLPDSFFRGEASAQTSPVGLTDLKHALKAAYDIRSKHVHTLALLHRNLKGIATHNDISIIDGKPVLTIHGLARVARSAIFEFVRRSPQQEKESYNFLLDIPGRLTLQLSPAMWISRAEGYSAENSRSYLNGYLSLLSESFLTRKEMTYDLRAVLEKIEILVPQTKKTNRLAMLVLYYIFGSACPKEFHGRFSAFLAQYPDDYFNPSIESLLVRVFNEVPPTWPLEKSESLLEEYMSQRYHSNGLNVGALFGAGMMLFVAELYRVHGNEVKCRELVSRAVADFPGLAALRTLEEKIKSGPIDPIVIDDVLLLKQVAE